MVIKAEHSKLHVFCLVLGSWSVFGVSVASNDFTDDLKSAIHSKLSGYMAAPAYELKLFLANKHGRMSASWLAYPGIAAW